MNHTAMRHRLTRLPASFIAGAVIVAVALLAALFPGSLSPYDPTAFDYVAILHPPSATHPFGTDNFGRDILSRTIWAFGVDLRIAFFCTLFPVIFGTALGALAGYRGGIVRLLMDRVIDAIITIPFLVLVIAIVAILGPGLQNLYLAVSCVGWVHYARLTASEVEVQKRLDYALAGKVLGYSEARILFHHIMPNCLQTTIVYWMTDLALCILLGSSLGYLGLGAQPPLAEWGVLIAEGRNYLSTAWWISLFPGIAIVLTGLGFSLLGDGTAELMKPGR